MPWRNYIDMAAERVALPVLVAVRFRVRWTASRSPPAARPITPAWSREYWYERFAHLPVEVDIASEFRYRDVPLAPRAPSASPSPSRAKPPTRWPR